MRSLVILRGSPQEWQKHMGKENGFLGIMSWVNDNKILLH